jgi:hypothetical protein
MIFSFLCLKYNQKKGPLDDPRASFFISSLSLSSQFLVITTEIFSKNYGITCAIRDKHKTLHNGVHKETEFNGTRQGRLITTGDDSAFFHD